MPGAEEAEVAIVQGCELRLVQPFDDGEDRGIDEAYVGRRVSVTEVADSWVVRFDERHDGEGSGNDVIEQEDEDTGVKPLRDPVFDLNQHGLRNDQRLAGGFDKTAAPLVVPVRAI